MGRLRILKLLQNIKAGDKIFVLNIPNKTEFIVATAKSKYKFETPEKYCGFGHLIEVSKIKPYTYSNTSLPKVKFQGYRKALNEVKNNKVEMILDKFIEKYYD